MSIKYFPTKADAQKEANDMKGWGKPQIVKFEADPYLPDSTETYAIKVNGNQYMHEDGYVR